MQLLLSCLAFCCRSLSYNGYKGFQLLMGPEGGAAIAEVLKGT